MNSDNQRLVDAVAKAVQETEYAPPNGEALLTECVIGMGWTDGDGLYNVTYARCGSSWGTRGLAEMVAKHISSSDDGAWEMPPDA